MKFIHEPEVIARFPNNFTKLFLVKNAHDLEALSNATEIMMSSLTDKDDHKIAQVIQKWRRVFEEMNAKQKYSSSLESLFNTFQESKKLYDISPIVNFYNAYSLQNCLPMAAYDYEKISGDLKLSLVPKGLPFSPLGNAKNIQPTKVKEVAYIDNEKVICRYWNLQDCDQTKITNSTKDVLFVFDIIANDLNEVNGISDNIDKDFQSMFRGNEIVARLTGKGLPNEVSIG